MNEQNHAPEDLAPVALLRELERARTYYSEDRDAGVPLARIPKGLLERTEIALRASAALTQQRDDARLTILTIAGVLGFSAPPTDGQLCGTARAVVKQRDKLLAALKDARAGLRALVGPSYEIDLCPETRRLDAAIAKAEGRGT